MIKSLIIGVIVGTLSIVFFEFVFSSSILTLNGVYFLLGIAVIFLGIKLIKKDKFLFPSVVGFFAPFFIWWVIIILAISGGDIL